MCLNTCCSVQEAVTLQAARSVGKQAVYGQNRQLEKEYLRLTSMPTLDAVRPPAVLKKALRHVLQRWLQVRQLATLFVVNFGAGTGTAVTPLHARNP